MQHPRQRLKYTYIYEDVCIYKKVLRKCNKKLSNVNTQFNCLMKIL